MGFSRTGLTGVLGLLLAVLSAGSSAPRDARNANPAHTKHPHALRQYKTLEEWNQRRAHLREQILTAAGLDPMPDRGALRARVVSTRVFGPVMVENLLLETFPGFYLAGNLYRPVTAQGRRPALLTPHGHWKHGRLEDTDEYSGPSLGYHLARLGFVVFAYDMVGYNDTRQLPHNFGNSASERLWSFHPLGLQLWNSIRVVDYLVSRDDVDSSRIGATGASGGGTQTFLLAAVDERIRAAAPVNMVSAHFQGGCDCENAPGLRCGANNVEIASMMAPRPLLLVAATGDWTRDTPKIEYPAVRAVYALHGAARAVQYQQFEAKHNYNQASREAVYRFFRREFLKDRSCRECVETPHPIADLQSLRVLEPEGLPSDALGRDALRQTWQEAQRTASLAAPDPTLRARLLRTAGLTWPLDVRLESGRLTRRGAGDYVPAQWLPADRETATLVVHPDGAAAAAEWWKNHHQDGPTPSLLFIDAFQTGAAVEPRTAPQGGHYLTFHYSDDAQRLQDILTALAFLQARGFREIRLVGVKKAAVWCLFAAAVSPAPLTLHARLNSFDGTDEDFEGDLFVPGIQRAGGLPAALRLVRASAKRWGEPHTGGQR